MNILTVPVRVDALIVRDSESVVSTADDFSKLPYVDSQHLDIGFDTANLASSIGKKPLNSYQQLPKGIHLHWSLPDAMTEGDIEENGEDDGIIMPIVPNRWLVRRVHQNDCQNVKSWIVESDYLYPDDKEPDWAVAIPAMTNKRDGAPQFQYLGRKITLEQWLKESEDEKQAHAYLPELNALGWGSPYFSSLYSDCHSVFGFHDDEFNDDHVKEYQYEVYGWYSDPKQDYVKSKLNKPGLTSKILASEVANWKVEFDSDEKLDALVCYGKIVFENDISLSDEIDTAGTTVALANTPSEVLATFLAKRQIEKDNGSEESAVKLENQILALLFNADVEGQDIDFVDRLKNARHKAEFDSVSGGSLWTLINDASLVEDIIDSKAKSRVQAAWASYKNDIHRELAELNRVQEALNLAEHRVAYHRRMLYNDWSKYMLSLHPTDLEGESYPDIDMLRLLMTQKTIPELENAIVQFSELKKVIGIKLSELQGDFNHWKIQFKTSDSLAIQLPEQLLESIPAPRYWQVKDPCILISGDVIKPSLRHGVDGELTCRGYSTDYESVVNWLLNGDVLSQWQWDIHGVNHWGKQPWSPLFTEWSVNIFPDQTACQSIQASQFDYNPDFITSKYRIPLNDEQFSLPSASVDLRCDRGNPIAVCEQPTVINGRSLITHSAANALEARLVKYIEEQDEASTSVSVNNSTESQINNSRIKASYTLLKSTDCAILTLDGLHDELLMYSQLSLMDIDDPFKFAPRHAGKQIMERVKTLLKGKDFKLPVVGHRFTPIKSGISKLGVVQLVDNFGRFKEVDCEDILRPNREVIGNTLYAPPRVLQPLRLSFRWVDNIQNDRVTPIQGWLGYNQFDETILIFDDIGVFLGHINSDGEWCNERGRTQSLAADMPKQLREYVLKLLSFHSGNRIIKSKFLEQNNRGSILWKQLLAAGVIRELTANKALLIPVCEDDWKRNIEPICSTTYSAARTLLIRSAAESNYWPHLKKAVRRAIDNIEPPTQLVSGQPGTIKPLAIVKAELDFQLKGGAETDKSWAALNQDLKQPGRSNRNYMDVEFPIKLGEYNNLDDGLVAYWRVSGGYQLLEDGFFPQSDMDDENGFIDAANFSLAENDYVDQIRQEGVANLKKSLQSEPITILMLMDPEAAVHATTGIVPKKSLYLPANSYSDVIELIRGRYFFAPILTPQKETAIALPVGETWKWEYPMGFDEQGQPKMGIQRNVDVLKKHDFFIEGGSEDDWRWLVDHDVITVQGMQTGDAVLNTGAQIQLVKTKDQLKLNILMEVINRVTHPGIVAISDVKPLNDKVHVIEGWLSAK